MRTYVHLSLALHLACLLALLAELLQNQDRNEPHDRTAPDDRCHILVYGHVTRGHLLPTSCGTYSAVHDV
jgi:hypothetical protein